MCVRRNAQHRELRLPESTQFVLITVMFAVSASGPTGCPVSPLPPLSSQNAQLHKKDPISHKAQGETPTISLALGANHEGKDRVKEKASRI